MWLKAVTLNLCPDFYQRYCPDHCILLYQKKGSLCEIYDKHQVFQTLDCIRYWRGASLTTIRHDGNANCASDGNANCARLCRY